MVRAQLFALCHIAMTLYALLAGGKAERRTAIILSLAWIGKLTTRRPFAVRFTSVEYGIMIVDAAALIALIAVALNSGRRWPTWMAGLQLTALAAHMGKALTPTTTWMGYQVILASVSWVMMSLVVAAVATRTAITAEEDPSLLTYFVRWVTRERGTTPKG